MVVFEVDLAAKDLLQLVRRDQRSRVRLFEETDLVCFMWIGKGQSFWCSLGERAGEYSTGDWAAAHLFLRDRVDKRRHELFHQSQVSTLTRLSFRAVG